MRNTILLALVPLLSFVGATGAQESSGVEESPDRHERQFTTGEALDLQEQLVEFRVDFDVDIKMDDSSRVLSVHLERVTETDGHGFLSLKWQRREVANLELVELGDDLFVIANATGQVYSKAPLGRWHIEEEGSLPKLNIYAGPAVGSLITNVEAALGHL